MASDIAYRKNYDASIGAFREAIDLDLASGESPAVAISLNDLAGAERLSGDLDAAESDYREALRISKGQLAWC